MIWRHPWQSDEEQREKEEKERQKRERELEKEKRDEPAPEMEAAAPPAPVEMPPPSPMGPGSSRAGGGSSASLPPMNLKFIGSVGNEAGVKVAVLVTERNEGFLDRHYLLLRRLQSAGDRLEEIARDAAGEIPTPGESVLKEDLQDVEYVFRASGP